MTIVRIPIVSREQWLGERRHDVTASNIAALFNVHPYLSALKHYMMHQGVEFPDRETERMKSGRILQPAVAHAVGMLRPTWKIIECTDYYRDVEARLGATPDFLFFKNGESNQNVLEAKTAAPDAWESAWDNGNKAPLWTELQLFTQMMLTDAAAGAIACLKVDPYDMQCCLFEIERNEKAEKSIRAAVRRFWEDVAASREPNPDFDKDIDLPSARWPRETTGKTIDLSSDNELPALLLKREMAMAEINDYKKIKNTLETEIKFKLADAEKVIGLADWSITYKTQHVAGYTVDPKERRSLSIRHRKAKR